MESFASDGTDYYALSLKPTETLTPAASRDIVIVLDTSASQAGQFRHEALAALESLLAGLPETDRVRLFTADLETQSLTDSFVGVRSGEAKAALEKLTQRAPLGSTDMTKVLAAANQALADSNAEGRVAVYIGDGLSSADLVETEEFAKAVAKLAENRVSFSSYAIGPRVDGQLLGALAGKTGGVILHAREDVPGKVVGASLAEAATSPVAWPTKVQWPAALGKAYPAALPPLRADRDSVVIGASDALAATELAATVEVNGKTKDLSWKVTPGESKPSNAYLGRLVKLAAADGGVSLPAVDSSSLQQMKNVIDIETVNYGELAKQALLSGDAQGATKLAQAALRGNPSDALAKKVLAQADGAAPAPAGKAKEADLDLVGDAPAKDPLDADGAFAEAFLHDQQLIAQRITADVQNTVNQARKIMGRDADAAIQTLKLQLENVKKAPALEPEVRGQLADSLNTAIREGERQRKLQELQRQEQAEKLASAKDRERITQKLTRDEEKARQLMARFNTLMDEGEYKVAQTEAAEEAEKLFPDDLALSSAPHYAHMKGAYEDAFRWRLGRQKGVIDMLAAAEKAAMPTADDPPFRYPDPEVWARLTKRRKEKYSAMDLAARGEAETKILAELEKPTKLEFIDTPLEDVIAQLKEYHQIEIQLDRGALDDMGIGTDTPVTRQLHGISLRSALRLMLGDLDLTYMIDNEVLMITTREKAESRLTTRVYPVADLVVPIQPPTMGGMGGMGMMGGMGGGNGRHGRRHGRHGRRHGRHGRRHVQSARHGCQQRRGNAHERLLCRRRRPEPQADT